MDTRSKILDCAALPAMAGPVTLVTGYFDVLRAAHVKALDALRESGGSLLVAVRPHAGAVLPQRARAELVAALRMVDYVVTADDRELDTLVNSLKPAQMVRLEDDDCVRSGELKRHVERRQSC